MISGSRGRTASRLRSIIRTATVGIVGVVLVVLSARPTPALEASPGVSAQVKKGYDAAAGELLCYCGCSRLTVKECTCGVAHTLRDEFEAKLAAGQSADSIIAAYIAEHGEQARTSPPGRDSTC